MRRAGGGMAAVAVLLAGCTLGPDYQRPEVAVPDVHRGGEPAPEELTDLAGLAWWELFGDPVLVELVGVALEENRELEIAVARIEEARARFRVVHADRLPSLGAAFDAATEERSPDLSASSGRTESFELVGTVSWEVDLFGRLRRADEAATARLVQAEEVRRGVALTLVADVARAYFELRDIDRRLAIALATVATRTSALEIARLRFKGGLTSQLEERQAETELAKAEVLVPELRQRRTVKEHELSLLLGRSPGDIRRGLDLGEVVPPLVPPGLPSELLERRPDVRAAEQDVVAANAEVGVAIASLYPRLALSGSGGSGSAELDSLLASGTGMWKIAADLATPLWQGGALRAEVEASRSRFRQAVLAYEQTVLGALGEVADGLAAVANSGEVLGSQRRLTRAARQYLELADLKYANGVAPYLDVLDAQRQLFTAELELSEATLDRVLATVGLYRALGGGWAAAAQETE